ncbi:MAG TPA: hypothetical protein VJB96_01680 [Patescibacteria group bacterium]|nr:hypothetical protein [Patescibacteria group bacterium]
MNKDALLATIIGFGIGLVIAAGVFLGPSLFKNMPQLRLPDLSSLLNTFKTSENREPTPTPKPNETLTIQSPLADSIEPKNETLISGMTAPEAIVVIEGESTETVAVANAQGAFAGKIALGEGKNDIVVTSYSKDNVQTQTVRVYYTPEDF